MKIYYTDNYVGDDGHNWFLINGDTHYDLDSGWTEESAMADYESPEHAIEDDIATRKAFGFYD